ncbi:MAG: NADH-quinone oxidoreductase subunit E, partial [Lentisphaerae bacterium]|nr:NADH-quinone oxidoreductase subunit E [Lentisphaerota bacterium]
MGRIRVHAAGLSGGEEMKKPLDVLADMRKQAVFRLFESKFRARMRITVGSATCENAAGADAVYAKLADLMAAHGVKDVSIGRVGCAGKCDMEPVVTCIGRGEIPVKYALMNPEKMEKVFAQHVLGGEQVYEFSMRRLTGAGPAERVISMCGGKTCPRRAAGAVEDAFKAALEKHGFGGRVALLQSACRGVCEDGPVAYVYPDGVAYERLTEESADRIVREHFIGGNPVAELARHSEQIMNRFQPVFGDIAFFGEQLRVTLRNCGVIDPESLDEYLAVDGYEAAARVLQSCAPEHVVEAMKKSGLRGRGGGGFPTATKWGFAAQQKSDVKYIICNADEGDPGAFMDRSTIEGDPHTIVEGMIIGGYATGANHGYVYIRAEYPLAIRRIEKAIADARRAGFLGKGVFGSGFDFDIEVRLGAGAFVCGEETALIHSIEGKRGMPRPRPPYPSVCGLWGKPTVINNVETFANVPVVILDGPDWFASVGTQTSKGTKV